MYFLLFSCHELYGILYCTETGFSFVSPRRQTGRQAGRQAGSSSNRLVQHTRQTYMQHTYNSEAFTGVMLVL